MKRFDKLLFGFIFMLGLTLIYKQKHRTYNIRLVNSTVKNTSDINTQDGSNTSHITQYDTNKDCQPRGFSHVPLPVTLLATYPGSGNTWTRHLIEQVTGVYTGSVYNDKKIARYMPGEAKRDGSVIAVKTHGQGFKNSYSKVILVIREPYAAAKSFSMLLKTRYNHTGIVNASVILRSPGGWNKIISSRIEAHLHFNEYWLNKRSSKKVLVILYEDLLNQLEKQLKRIARFLDVKVKEEVIRCVLSNSEGKFHRKHVNDHESDKLYDALTPKIKDRIKFIHNKLLNATNKLVN